MLQDSWCCRMPCSEMAVKAGEAIAGQELVPFMIQCTPYAPFWHRVDMHPGSTPSCCWPGQFDSMLSSPSMGLRRDLSPRGSGWGTGLASPVEWVAVMRVVATGESRTGNGGARRGAADFLPDVLHLAHSGSWTRRTWRLAVE